MTNLYVFDSYAVMAQFENEAGAEWVTDTLADSENAVSISAINAGEVLYALHRRRGPEGAAIAEGIIFAQPRLHVVEATWPRVRAAAMLKAGGGISYADAFAAGLAQELDAPLVTGDHEFERLERSGVIRVIWLR